MNLKKGNILHHQVSSSVMEAVRDYESFLNLSDFFSVFSDSTRLKLIFLLAESELCVHDIALLINMSQSAVSHQLRVLRQTGIVKYRKKGREVIYSLKNNNVRTIINSGFDYIKGEADGA